VVTIDGTKRVAFTNGKSPGGCYDAMVKAYKEKKINFKDDTPYERPIDG
jgi:hypothetical protein